eukprot:TRINITY_DN5780_c1_g1_i1.p1 TRINITY_DN5780_c1_g1~~TRINITY_DN5780_c1_g1_i1.p1  ORF type:complete len:154 (+),score=49.28 TRINITY_DN5780_c1_g1_i1:96-557(+)
MYCCAGTIKSVHSMRVSESGQQAESQQRVAMFCASAYSAACSGTCGAHNQLVPINKSERLLKFRTVPEAGKVKGRERQREAERGRGRAEWEREKGMEGEGEEEMKTAYGKDFGTKGVDGGDDGDNDNADDDGWCNGMESSASHAVEDGCGLCR